MRHLLPFLASHPRSMQAASALLCLGLLCATSGCGNSASGEPGKPDLAQCWLSGAVQEAEDPKLMIRSADSSLLLALDADSRFEVQIPLRQAGYLTVLIGNESTKIWARPGDTLHMDLNYAAFDESLTYSGTLPGPSRYLAAKYLYDEAAMIKDLTEDFPFNLSETVFADFADRRYNERLALLEAQALPAEFLDQEGMELKVDWGEHRMRYIARHRSDVDPAYEASKGYWSFFEQLPWEHVEITQTGSFPRLAKDLLWEKLDGRGADESPVQYTLRSLDSIPVFFNNPAVQQHLFGHHTATHINNWGLDGADLLLAKLEALGADHTALDKAHAAVARWEALEPGNPAPGFAGFTPDGKRLALADYLGKVVYVDVWATWCGPCRAELPHLKALAAEYADNDRVALISLSVDQNAEQWRVMLDEQDMEGIQLIAEGAPTPAFLEAYGINGIPRFILIDPEGKLVDVDAVRPSSGEVAGRIDAVLASAAS